MMTKTAIASALFICAGCTAGISPGGETPGVERGKTETFDISAETVECVRVGPMRCLIVSGELFYDQIEGYDHVEGQSAVICVSKASRPEPIPADASAIEYRRVACS